MLATHVIAVDLAKVFSVEKPKSLVTTLTWGDFVEVTGEVVDSRIPVSAVGYPEKSDGSILPERMDAFIRVPKGMTMDDIVIPAKESRVLKVNFVDVQQGDGCIIESPKRRVVLVDGGDNQMFARYLAARFRGTTEDKPRRIDAIVVTHGDADHFAGLTEIHESEKNPDKPKRLFIHPERIFHNGIFKRPSEGPDGKKRPDLELLNDTTKQDGRVYLSPLVDDPSLLPDSELNKPFREWKSAIEAWKERGAVEVRRLEIGAHDAFDFLGDESIRVEVLGPVVETLSGGSVLPFLGTPPKGPRIGTKSFQQVRNRSRGIRPRTRSMATRSC